MKLEIRNDYTIPSCSIPFYDQTFHFTKRGKKENEAHPTEAFAQMDKT